MELKLYLEQVLTSSASSSSKVIMIFFFALLIFHCFSKWGFGKQETNFHKYYNWLGSGELAKDIITLKNTIKNSKITADNAPSFEHITRKRSLKKVSFTDKPPQIFLLA